MSHLLEIVWDILNVLGCWPERKSESAHQSQLDRLRRIFGKLAVIVSILFAVGFLVLLYFTQ